jgi:hypothetical protein
MTRVHTIVLAAVTALASCATLAACATGGREAAAPPAQTVSPWADIAARPGSGAGVRVALLACPFGDPAWIPLSGQDPTEVRRDLARCQAIALLDAGDGDNLADCMRQQRYAAECVGY